MRSPINHLSRRAGILVGLLLAGCAATTSSPTPSETVAASPVPSASASAQASLAPSASASSEAEGQETSVFDLRAGDCFSAVADQLETVFVVDCDRPHVYEAFFVFDHPADAGDAFPGNAEIVDYADTECQPAFEEFVDFDYQTSIWYITSVTPSDETWAEGDREIICTLNTEQETEVTGSAEGSAE